MPGSWRIVTTLFAAILLFHIALFTPASRGLASVEARSNERCIELLEEAHRISSTLPLEQRAWTVFDATEVATSIDPKRANQWALEAWGLAKQLPLGQSRVALQKDALRELAINDPDRALRLYKRQDLPAKWDAVHQSTEDARSLGYGNTIFKTAWEHGGPRYLGRLMNLASFLGRTGQYPYAAMGKIAVDLPKGDRRQSKIWRDATRFFQRDPGFATTNKQFVSFILSTRKIVTAKLLQGELNAAIPALEAPPRGFTKAIWRITITTPNGAANFISENEALLYELLPIVRLSEPGKADDLLARYASLRNAPEVSEETRMVWTGSVSLEGTADSARMQARADESRVFRVQTLAAAAPKDALVVAKQISDPDLRGVALVSLAPAYAKVDAAEADSWLAEAKSRLETISENPKKLRLMAVLVQAQVALGRYAEALPLIQQGFDLGEAVFLQDFREHPDQLVDSVAGYSELTDLTTAALKSESESRETIARIERVQPEALRAELLIAAAKGWFESEAEN
jgi:hypothetical protein